MVHIQYSGAAVLIGVLGPLGGYNRGACCGAEQVASPGGCGHCREFIIHRGGW